MALVEWGERKQICLHASLYLLLSDMKFFVQLGTGTQCYRVQLVTMYTFFWLGIIPSGMDHFPLDDLVFFQLSLSLDFE